MRIPEYNWTSSCHMPDNRREAGLTGKLKQKVFDTPLILLVFAVDENIKLLRYGQEKGKADFAAQAAVGNEPVAFGRSQTDLAGTGLENDAKLIDINWTQLHNAPPGQEKRGLAVVAALLLF